MPAHHFIRSHTPSRRLTVLLLSLLGSIAVILLLYQFAIGHFEERFRALNADALLIVKKDTEVLAHLNRTHNALLLLIEQHEATPLSAGELKQRNKLISNSFSRLQGQMRELIAFKREHRGPEASKMLESTLGEYLQSAAKLQMLIASDIEAAEEEAVALMPVLGNLQTELFEHLTQEISEVRQSSLQNYENYNRQRLWLEIIATGIMLAISLFMLASFRRMNVQLRSAEEALKRLSNGQDDIRLPDADTSFAPLFAGLQHFRQTLQDNRDIRQLLQQQNEMLEAQVKERTAFLEAEIHQRREAEKQQKLFETIFRHTDDAVLITDEEAVIITANQAYQRLTGRNLAQLVGKKPPISSSGHHDKVFYEQLWDRLRADGRWRGEIVNRHANGSLIHAMMTINAIHRDDGSVCNYVSILSDITRLKDAEDKLRQMAYFDPLTKLPNRALLADRLTHEIQIARNENQQFAVVFMDLDRFKFVNDTLGHKAGDTLLGETAERLLAAVHQDDTVSRLSGDEFCLLLRHSSASDTALTCENILQTLARPFLLDGREMEIGASIGIALYPDNGNTSETLMKNADAAMYQAKSQGRNQYCFFETAIAIRLKEEMTLYTLLRKGIEESQFVLYYQPIIALDDNLSSYAESLIRWPQADGSMISPGVFIPFAESHGLIEPISNLVVERACQMLRQARSLGINRTVSINISARQLSDQNLPYALKAMLNRHSLPANAIELELTESALISDLATAKANLQALRTAGFSISIDDFGAGYSSLNYLVELPIDKVKIDQHFIWTLFNSPRNQAVVKAILELARAIGIRTVAEGVETQEQYDFLHRHGCHYIQGYLLARPLPEHDYLAYCQQQPAVDQPLTTEAGPHQA